MVSVHTCHAVRLGQRRRSHRLICPGDHFRAKLGCHDISELPRHGELPLSGTASAEMSLPVGIPRLVTAVRLPVPSELAVYGLKALRDPSGDRFDRLASG
jgi:hypothetical protein